jgi:hypothetical protein
MQKLWNEEARRTAQTTIGNVVKEITNEWKHFSEICDHKKYQTRIFFD